MSRNTRQAATHRGYHHAKNGLQRDMDVPCPGVSAGKKLDNYNGCFGGSRGYKDLMKE
jgi:hypothetical protein